MEFPSAVFLELYNPGTGFFVAADNPLPYLFISQKDRSHPVTKDSRLDIKLSPVKPIGHHTRGYLTNIGEYEQDDSDGCKDTSSSDTVFSPHCG